MASMNEFFSGKQTRPNPVEASKSDKARPKGVLERKVYDNYYINSDTITTAQVTNPNDPDNVNYNVEPVFQSLERRAEEMWISNDAAAGGPTIFFIVSHVDVNQFSREFPVYPQQFVHIYNIFEVRLRSSIAGTPYRISEYELGAI